MVKKVEFRRVVYAKCVVAPPGEGSSSAVAAPNKVTVSVRRPRRCCGLMGGSWKEVGMFSFKDRPKAPYFSNAFLDLERLFKYSRKADAAATQVKICVSLRSGETRVARVDLKDFMGQLFQSGRPDWVFLYLHEGMVTLMQANIPLSNVPPEWPFDGMARDAHQGPKGEKNSANDESNATGPEESQEKMVADQGAKDNGHSNDDARKAEDVFPAEDEENDVTENEKETQEETLEDITLDTDLDTNEGTDGEGGWETDDEESDGLNEQDSDGSGWETLDDDEETMNTDEGPRLGGSLGVLARLGAAWRHGRGLLLAAAAVSALVVLISRQPPDDLENWLWGAAGGEL